jgi:hypothetical protein
MVEKQWRNREKGEETITGKRTQAVGKQGINDKTEEQLKHNLYSLGQTGRKRNKKSAKPTTPKARTDNGKRAQDTTPNAAQNPQTTKQQKRKRKQAHTRTAPRENTEQRPGHPPHTSTTHAHTSYLVGYAHHNNHF